MSDLIQVSKALALLRSMIDGGEYWTDSSRQAYEDAQTALLKLVEDHEALRQAVNEDATECDPKCDSYGHTETCNYTDMAATLISLQTRHNQLLEEHEALAAKLVERGRLYHELLYAVETKHPDESRHETALRYITQTEHRVNGPCQATSPQENNDER